MTKKELDVLALAMTPEDLSKLATAITEKELKRKEPDPDPKPVQPSAEMEQLALALSRRILLLQKEILSVAEVVEYTGLSKSYIYKLTHERAIPFSKPGGNIVYFKRADVEAWMLSNPVASQEEIGYRANDYLLSHTTKASSRKSNKPINPIQQ